MQLEESTQALEAASRLSEQLDAKEEMILHLKNECKYLLFCLKAAMYCFTIVLSSSLKLLVLREHGYDTSKIDCNLV